MYEALSYERAASLRACVSCEDTKHIHVFHICFVRQRMRQRMRQHTLICSNKPYAALRMFLNKPYAASCSMHAASRCFLAASCSSFVLEWLTRWRCRCCRCWFPRLLWRGNQRAAPSFFVKGLCFVCPEIGADGWRCRCFFPRHAVRHIEAPVFVLQVFFFCRLGLFCIMIRLQCSGVRRKKKSDV